MIRSLLLALATVSVSVSPAAHAGESPDVEPTQTPEAVDPRKPTFALLPSLAYNPDDGLGLGVFGDIEASALAGEARRHRYRIGVNGKIWLKPPQIGWETRLGLSWFPQPAGDTEVQAAFITLGRPGDWWFGIGQDTVRDRRFVTEDDPVKDYWHRFMLFQIRGDGRIFQRVAGPLELFGGLRVTATWVRVRPDTLLEHQAGEASMPGIDGGPTVAFDGGLRVDTRDWRLDPQSGGLVLGVAQANVGPGAPWGRFVADLRGYVGTPKGEVVFAGEALIQVAVGDIPFNEQGVIAGFELSERAFTGLYGGRALDRGRLRGPLGLMLHGEARFRPPGFQLFKWLRLRFEPVLWADAVRVDAPGRLGAGLPLQPSLGGGFMTYFNEVTVARLNIGTSPEQLLDADGQRTRWTFGVYSNVGHAF